MIPVVLAFAVGSALVQDPRPAAPLGRADAVLQREFSQIRGVRELRDGRVLVTDWVDEVLLVADFGHGTVRQIGRKGSGPKEYRLPASLLPLPGDSTLLVDQGNERLAVVAPDLSITRSFSSHRPGMTHAVIPRGVDAAGRFYFEIPNWTRPGTGPNDSVIVARWDPRTGREEPIGRVRAETFRERQMRPGIPYVIFAPQDVWQVNRDGRVAFVRAGDYHVEWRDPAAGRLTRGPATSYRPLPVSAADRTDYVRSFVSSSPMGGRGISGLAATPAAMSSPEAIARMVPNQEFAAVRPPFTDFTPRIGSDGTLWVERSVPAGAPRVFDLFDRQGVRRQAVALPPGRRLLSLGAGTVYLAAGNEDGVERLERYRFPAPK